MNILDKILDPNEYYEIVKKLDAAGDKQSVDLMYEVRLKLLEELSLSVGASQALSRLEGMVSRGKNWDPSLLRNNVFKAANSLDIKLPSGMF